ncbi:MAG TPA: peptidase [Novosphingobium sp.]|nr:peptidase [Novosphingobium sp.]
MTYCVGMMLERGLVLMSDTRTNSGVDNISTFRKMFHWEEPGERIIALMAAGNLATTQSVISQLEERDKAPAERQNRLLQADTMVQVATIVGELLQGIIARQECGNGHSAAGTFSASMIVAGQFKGMEPCLFLIYPEGNFIEASFDTPFFQIGETKYGRPILIRAYDPKMTFENAVKLLTVSFDSSLKANLSVGMPLDLLLIERDRLEPLHERRIECDDPYFQAVSMRWGEALKQALDALPDYRLAPGP